jgi:SAM-dependent methyltransferase
MSESSAERWDAVYTDTDQPPPWVIAEPQPEVVALADRGMLTGRLLDAGCGTGEHALLAAARGATVTGVDISPRAVARAQGKAAERGADVAFAVVDLLGSVPFEDASFDTVLDSGVFHSFADDDQAAYVGNLTRVTAVGGRLHLLCFSEYQPGDWGPRRITQAELRAAFTGGWSVEELEPAVFRVNEVHGTTRVQAWRAHLLRV